MDGTKKQVFTIQVEDGKPGKDGRPAVGPVFKSILAKYGYPPLDPDMRTSWDVFRRYISYDALRGDAVPCSRPGVPYYNCRISKAANPYTRGCESITMCRDSEGN